MDSNGTPVICEVCGTYFETRRGLSSHARLHLRQLGVSMSESSGAPIELLYKILEEKDDVPLSNPESSASPATPLPQKAAQKESTSARPVTKDKGSSSSKAWSKFTTVSSQKSASPPGFKEYAASLPSLSSNSSTSVGSYEPVAKPLWAPQLTDAPLTLASNSKDEAHVCQLCGAWYETRKGLASHARAHLRQLGITESGDGKSPIELLKEIIKAEDFKPGSSGQHEVPFNLHSPAKSTTKRPSALSTTTPTLKGSPSSALLHAPPGKRARTTSEDYTCILCGEEFENRRGLGSHSRSHLRQIGVSHLLEKGSAIDTVQELVSSGVLAGIRPLETNNAGGGSLSAPSPSHSRSLSPATSSTQSPSSPANRAPKAKKGFRLAVDPLSRKLKPEDVDMFFPISPERYSNSGSPAQKLSNPAAERSHSAIPEVQCDVCSQLFDSRKALSCHARAHLRQLGIAWSVNESPIDILRDVLAHEVKKESTSSSSGHSSASAVPMWAPQGPKNSLDSRYMLQDPPSKLHYNSPLDFSVKEKSSPTKSTQAAPVTSCELCGFEFDNRKALASHARAHLRQLGVVVEWKAEGMKGLSPITMLHDFIQKEPAKVVEITRRYQTGDLFIKKTHKNALSPAPSDSDSVSGPALVARQSVHKVYLFNGESSKGTPERPHAARSHMQARAACTDLNARSSTGFWPQKSSMATEEENSQQASRSGNIPALLPRPPRTPLVKLVGKVYSLKCRFCEEVFQGPLSVQGDWIRHLQKHILSLGYRGKASTLPAPVAAPALVGPVAV